MPQRIVFFLFVQVLVQSSAGLLPAWGHLQDLRSRFVVVSGGSVAG